MYLKTDNITVDFPVAGGIKRALNEVSLSISAGERVGIVGRNGAGKTTLLQVMAGLLSPTSGSVDVDGHVACVMTLGVGLREEMTGRENIYLDGELNGKSRDEVDLLIDGMVEFADIGCFIDYPVRTYSTGMKARLGFSLITFIEPEILIIDEALSVGDEEFGRKATRKMKELCAKGNIVILVSHSMKAINGMCDRCVLLEDGQVVMDGSPKAVTQKYIEKVRLEEEMNILNRFQGLRGSKSYEEGFRVEGLKFYNAEGKPKVLFEPYDDVKISFVIEADRCLEQPDIKISFEQMDGIILLENFASDDGFKHAPLEGRIEIEIEMGTLNFGQNTFAARVELYERRESEDLQLLASNCEVIKVEKPVEMFDTGAYIYQPEIEVVKLC